MAARGPVVATMWPDRGRNSFEGSAEPPKARESWKAPPHAPPSTSAPTGARPRPGLAFLLAILAIPGSTIAWELPAGGFWIGLPLAVAAIALGVVARRGGRSKLAMAAIIIGGLVIAQMVVYTIVSAF